MSTVSASRRSPSLRPALVVLAVAVVVVVGSALLSIVGSGSSNAPAAQLGTSVPGVPFRAIPAAADLRHVEGSGEPPADVVKALTVPANSHYVGSDDEDGGAGQFDRSVTFSVPAPSGTVESFYTKELRGSRWSMEFSGKAAGHLELIAQRNGSDGYQWRVAVVIASVNPALTPALAGSDQTSTSSVVMTLYQVEDAS